VLAVYETVVPPGGGAVTAADDDADVLTVTGDEPGRQRLRRRVRR
jgi:phosphatidylinositol alpha-mannosyltransferase